MSFYTQLKYFLMGSPLPTSAFAEERLTKAEALAVLSSDALSSVAYATEEILLVLIVAGSGVLKLSLPIAGGIIFLLIIITLSYRQTIRAYPQGGGAYTVARENLGLYPGLIAAASLMIDYILTVTVSVAAGIAALTSAIPQLEPVTVELCLLLIFLLMLANLRGLRSSGKLFSLPTYSFIVTIFLLIGMGMLQSFRGQITSLTPSFVPQKPLTLFLLCRAFAAGCTALTGVEAISNGVMVFKSPEWKNARLTLMYMVTILGLMFLGITYLSHLYHIVPQEQQTVLSQLGRQIWGDGFFYYILQGTTLLILLLAANTSYADFPRLSYFLARDDFLPRQLLLLGDRLVYSNGIIFLSFCAAILVFLFKGQVNAIIPLYAVGVFTSFTLSQAGMVHHWLKEKSSRWQQSVMSNGFGTVVTAIVLMILITTKFAEGAWLVLMTIPLLVWIFLAIHRHYQQMKERLSIDGLTLQSSSLKTQTEEINHPAIILVGQLNRGTIQALDYARTIADQIVAVHVNIGETDEQTLQQKWQQLESDIPLIILDSPYRSIVRPLREFIGNFEAQYSGQFCTIILPVFMARHWWEDWLHNQTVLFLRQALRAKKSRVITTVRFYV
jgi:amino acid transporter